ncbi:hypothetical protein LOB45_00745 [Lactobacillus delbrueckii subsp. lactis]|nr:hypothetical protein [Lactobacillus delbrueckii]MCD5483693.1 hypothetical protein [Lactobacillus delbrueckii subsp. lactis]
MMKVALVGCSNPLKAAYRPVVDQLVKILEDRGLEVVVSQFLTDDTLIGRGEKRARDWKVSSWIQRWRIFLTFLAGTWPIRF